MQSYHLPLFSAACQQKDSVTTALLTQSEYKYSFFCWRQNQLSQFKAALSYIHIYIVLFNFAPSKHTSTVDFASRNVYVATCSWCMVRVAVPAPTQVFAERCSCLCYASSHHSVYLNMTPFISCHELTYCSFPCILSWTSEIHDYSTNPRQEVWKC